MAPEQDRKDTNCTTPMSSELEQHQRVRKLLRNTWNVFFAAHRRLRDVQLQVIPDLMSGANILVSAPTAGGKTEAVIAPVSERILRDRLPALSCLYISPTRALVNDLYTRLHQKLDQLGLRLGRQTGDHAQRAGSNILLTTPESLESMLTFNKLILKDVRFVVLDEIHLLDGSARGDQLRLLLKRLRKLIESLNSQASIQFIALSATVAEPQRIADAYLGSDAKVFAVGGQRGMECQYHQQGQNQSLVDSVLDGIKKFSDVSKILIFVNARKVVDDQVDQFREKFSKNFEVFGHHGSLATETREKVEGMFRSAKRAVCIATMTLEIGIDIGDVDLVVCVEPPHNISSFLQRIGRGCRRLQSETRVLCIFNSEVSELIFRAFESGAKLGIPQIPLSPLRRSVVFQQILAYLRQTDKRRRTESQLIGMFTSQARPSLSPETIIAILKDMEANNFLSFDRGVYSLGSQGDEFVHSRRIYSNLEPQREIAIVEAESGKTVAYVAGTTSSSIKIAGQKFEISGPQNSNALSVRSVVHAPGATSPLYRSKRGLGFGSDVGICLARLLGVPPVELVALHSQFIFTWLGIVHNMAISEVLNSIGVSSTPATFGIQFADQKNDAELLAAIRDAVNRLVSSRSSLESPISHLVDGGAHQHLLGEELVRASQNNWIDFQYLKDWINKIERCRTLPDQDPNNRPFQLIAHL